MKCPKCQSENEIGAKFCNECGAKLEIACPECGKPNRPGSKFCNECGHSLVKPEEAPPIDYALPHSYTPKHLAEKILTTRSSIEGERKLVTVMFADVANFTSLSEQLDPEEVHQIMDGCFKILIDEIHRYEGTINQFTGDGVMALFGAPVAHEDHAQRACHAALAIQRAMEGYGERVRKDHGLEFRIRVGLNSGPVIVGRIGDDLRMDYTAVGDTTNLAARVQQVALPGQVWVSQETRNLIQGYFVEEPAGEVSLKGKADAQELHRVLSERPQVRTRFEAGLARGVTKMVGRGSEMRALRSAFERAREGEAQVIDVVGEAGVGKSRLVYEFQKGLGPDASFFIGVCLHYGQKISFLPVTDVVKAALEIRDGMSEAEVGKRIVEKAQGSLAPFVPFYRSLLSLDVDDPRFNSLNPEGRKYGTFDAVKNVLLEMSKVKPLVVFLEDVHWMDKISEEFFTYFSRCIHGNQVMMLTAYRPEGSPSWAQGALYQKLGLETLSLNSSIRLVMNLLGGLELEPALEGKIAEKAGGNPFFMEEIVRELLERGDLIREENRYLCRRPLDQLEIPGTIQGVIAARMDRLSEELKRTMQVASVIGRDFAFRLLKSIMELGEELRGHLTNLVGLEVLYEKALYPEMEYIFKHALTQEVAYESLLKQRRREIHGRIARAIEELYGDSLEEHYELLAHHYERSGDARKTVEYLVLAGEKSARNMASQAVYEFYGKALNMAARAGIDLDPRTETSVHLTRGQACSDMGDIEGAIKEFNEANEIARRQGFSDMEMEALSYLAFAVHMSSVSVEEANSFFERVIERAQEVGRKDVWSSTLARQGMHRSFLNRVSEGNRIMQEALQMAEQTQNFLAIAACRVSLALSERWLGRPKMTLELTEGVIDPLRATFNVTYFGFTAQFRGLALAEIGRIEEAMALIRDAIDLCEKAGGWLTLCRLYNCLGYCYGEIHQPDRAWGLNLRGREVARNLMEQYPMGRQLAAEVAAHSEVNLMENLFDQGESDTAWERMESFRKESRGEVYDRLRIISEPRMDYLAVQILLQRGHLDEAAHIIAANLEMLRREQMRKKQGYFLRVLGEVQAIRGQFDNAIASVGSAIAISQEVGNPRHLWQGHASLASVYKRMERESEARDQWGASAQVIQKLAGGLSDRDLREGFLNARPIKEILAKVGV